MSGVERASADLADDEVIIRIKDGTPEAVAENIPTEYSTRDLIIRLDQDDEFGPQAWDPYFPTLWYTVFQKDGDGAPIGDIGVTYDYEAKTMEIENTVIYDEYRRRGYGAQMYESVPTMALPDGRSPHEAGFTFITEDHSMEAEKVWRSLEKRGLVVNVGGRAYMWANYGTPPTA